MISSRLSRSIFLFFSLMTLPSCAARTVYQGIPVDSLSDEQLVEELESAARGFGIEFNRTMYLMAVRPEPAYVMTSSTTNVVGSASATYNAYAMPVGYGLSVRGSASGTVSGVATTRYQYTDVTAAARLGNAIATAISRSRREAYRRRGLEVLEEYQRRVTARRLEAERTIEDFFNRNPSLQDRRTLVAAVAPWAAAEGQSDDQATLQRTKELIEALPRGEGLEGTWYGAFSQTTTTEQGEVFAFSEFVRVSLEQDGDSLSGSGVLGTGEKIELVGRLEEQEITMSVANTTSAINSRLTGIVAPNQITGEFTGFGSGIRLEGTFTLLR